jgi:hypothetical protein
MVKINWEPNKWVTTLGKGELGTNGWIHCYEHPLNKRYAMEYSVEIRDRLHAAISNLEDIGNHATMLDKWVTTLGKGQLGTNGWIYCMVCVKLALLDLRKVYKQYTDCERPELGREA